MGILISYKKINGPSPASFSMIFGVFQTNITFLQQNNEKNVHPVQSARIQTHDLWNMSLILLPLDQGIPPTSKNVYDIDHWNVAIGVTRCWNKK